MAPTPPFRKPLSSRALVFAAGALWWACAHAAGPEALRAAYEKRADALEHSPFRQPLVVESSSAGEGLSGEVHAVLDHPFETVAATLRQPDAWCDVLTLQTNIKACAVDRDPATALRVSIVRRSDQPLSDAYEVSFRYATQGEGGRFLSTRLDAAEGPLGTRDYRLAFEAVPLDAGHSFVRIAYSYASGVAARLATKAYLASAGRDKVGFSVTGQDERGAPVYVGGLQGVAERNTMRYFLAIESTLKARRLPAAERRDFQLHDFHAGVEQYARQLHEMSLGDYLVLKRREPGSQR
jgi:hypothetical protein